MANHSHFVVKTHTLQAHGSDNWMNCIYINGGGGLLTNERPWTGHVIRGSMRSL